MFYKKSDDGYREALEGIRLKTLVYGEKTLMSEFRLDKGKTLPMHSHPHEQSGYVVSGRINLIIEDKTFEAGPGDGMKLTGSSALIRHSMA